MMYENMFEWGAQITQQLFIVAVTNCHKVHFIYTMLHEQETIQDMLLRIRKQKYDKSLVINQG